MAPLSGSDREQVLQCSRTYYGVEDLAEKVWFSNEKVRGGHTNSCSLGFSFAVRLKHG